MKNKNKINNKNDTDNQFTRMNNNDNYSKTYAFTRVLVRVQGRFCRVLQMTQNFLRRWWLQLWKIRELSCEDLTPQLSPNEAVKFLSRYIQTGRLATL